VPVTEKCKIIDKEELSKRVEKVPRGGDFYWQWPEVSMTLARSSRPNYYRPFPHPLIVSLFRPYYNKAFTLIPSRAYAIHSALL